MAWLSDLRKILSTGLTTGSMTSSGSRRSLLQVIHDKMATAKKTVKKVAAKKTATKKVEAPENLPVADRPLTKKERMAQRQGFAK